MVLPSLMGTRKGRIPRSSPFATSFAQTTATVGSPAGIVGGMNLKPFGQRGRAPRGAKNSLGGTWRRGVENELAGWEEGSGGLEICDVETMTDFGHEELSAGGGTMRLGSRMRSEDRPFAEVQEILDKRYQLGSVNGLAGQGTGGQVNLDSDERHGTTVECHDRVLVYLPKLGGEREDVVNGQPCATVNTCALNGGRIDSR